MGGKIRERPMFFNKPLYSGPTFFGRDHDKPTSVMQNMFRRLKKHAVLSSRSLRTLRENIFFPAVLYGKQEG